MSDQILQTVAWAGLIGGVVAVLILLESVLRKLVNRYGTPQNAFRGPGRLSGV